MRGTLESNRRAKAAAIYGYLLEAGVTPLEAGTWTPEVIQARLRPLGTTPVSAETWEVAMQMLAGAPVAEFDFTHPDDPFDGINGEPITQGPRPGDVVEMPDGKRGVIDGGDHYGPGFLMVVLNASAHRSPDTGHVSCSGGPCPCVPVENVTRTGTVVQKFWRWKDTPRRDGGVDYLARVTLWTVTS